MAATFCKSFIPTPFPAQQQRDSIAAAFCKSSMPLPFPTQQQRFLSLQRPISREERRPCLKTKTKTKAVSITGLTIEEMQRHGAQKAVEHVNFRMVVGLGAGSIASGVVEVLARLCKIGKIEDVVAVPTSKLVREQAVELGMTVATLKQNPRVDVMIDGADAVDSDLNFVSGRDGDVIRRKMVASASQKLIIVIDDSRFVDGIGGEDVRVPVEVVPFSWKYNAWRLESLFKEEGCKANLRKEGKKPYRTDDSNYILDLLLKSPLKDPRAAAKSILELDGVVEHGLFVDAAPLVIYSGQDGVFEKTKQKA
eukprot:TRINITY_DN950_c0_g1_i1.p1 TRINITY_DN950_c0_g1~~TRINITY_DN950_c0_g1_i1.p1  ORF type:complete len:309 (+),score=47.30 TRINITY_DN950_c0_g1_i1:186-1112(+)